jgi:hypothetical protein
MLRRLRRTLLRTEEAKIGVSNWCAFNYNFFSSGSCLVLVTRHFQTKVPTRGFAFPGVSFLSNSRERREVVLSGGAAIKCIGGSAYRRVIKAIEAWNGRGSLVVNMARNQPDGSSTPRRRRSTASSRDEDRPIGWKNPGHMQSKGERAYTGSFR